MRHSFFTTALYKTYYWLKESISIQLLLTIAVMPFLICWRLPYTPMTILGNLIHPFFLIPFLGLSSILFFATLLGLPTGAIRWLLIKTHYCWEYVLMHYSYAYWLQPRWWHFLLSIGLLGIVWAYMHGRCHRRTLILTIVAAGALLIAVPTLGPAPGITQLHRGTATLTFWPHKDGTLLLHDNGFISRAANTDAIMDYEVIPHLIAHYGHPAGIKIGAHHIGKRLTVAQQILNEWGFTLLRSPHHLQE